jgi:hypothetical protein
LCQTAKITAQLGLPEARSVFIQTERETGNLVLFPGELPITRSVSIKTGSEMGNFKLERTDHQTNYLSSDFSPIIVLQIEFGTDIIQS